jgi:radical SAM family RiPP maturation amino acid epimerase
MQLSAPSAEPTIIDRVRSLYLSGDILPLYNHRTPEILASDYAREVAEVKRFLERWSADDEFRQAVDHDANAAARAIGLSIDAAALAPLWDSTAAMTTPVERLPLSLLRYRAWIWEKLEMREALRRQDPTMDRRYAGWRQRQLNRVESQLHPVQNEGIVHAPFCVELTHGCSVGCWFCGISAPKLGDLFLYTPENAELFRGVVRANQELFGEAAGRGFLYWATDPIDNPDYERFMVDFHGLTGAFPQTTTALALKDVERTRALLRLSLAKGGKVDRFSLLTLKQLVKVHEQFTPLELLFVELVLQNKENVSIKVRAGRAEERKPKKADPQHVGNQLRSGTIACVSGFLINMVERTVKLISPCEADDRWPLGYIVYAERHFADAADYRRIVQALADEQMKASLRARDPIAFFDYFRYEANDDGFVLTNQHHELSFDSHPVFAPLGERLAEGRRAGLTVEALVDQLSDDAAVDAADVWYALELMHGRGVLDTLPPAPAADLVQVRR